MKKAAVVFPGQGSQGVGMGLDLFEKFEEAREVYKEVSTALNYDIAKLCFSGPKEELNKTYRTQPALLTTSIAAYRVLLSKGIKPEVLAGHSLGEYSALVAAGVLTLTAATKLTEMRGRFMQDAVPEGQGLMAAILGLNREIVDNICLAVKSGYVAPANYNCPEQTVIAGEKPAVEEAMILARSAGAKRAVPLAVSVPSHCTLMVSASEKLSKYFDGVEFKNAEIPIVNNADAMLLVTADQIRSALIRQLNSPLLWEDSVRKMVDTGVEVFIEVGPITVLSGLIKRIDSTVTLLNVQDSASLDRTVAALNN
ncbi:MAG: ACP S-malonyltransferase [Nitrospirae bacterium]|nr:ACP S-malonyltransferase [Nitrospirota bacterium]MBF0520179.1 ACP S-malonyltransferase [Nitrospirota bacterium]MBF0520292.1 ACP S-malonyltransferase [Nitrospirota bacterium]MBF0536245.1 ACP S-malonyltransferase [Nitrospirota bacterium]MBF0615821.1 ACP S-malonyltransferase [Nitrospirota bacterium]